MKTFKNTSFKKRDYECTNVVFAVGDEMPSGGHWVECNNSEIEAMRCTQLWIQGATRYFGYM